jgi:tRNA (pseudouridine54-N1)-methyltransferase
VKKALAAPTPASAELVEVKPGVSVAEGDLEVVLADARGAAPYCLSEEGADVRSEPLDAPDSIFFLGDHVGLDEATMGRLAALRCRVVSVGPVSLHTDDVVTLVTNELDRRLETWPLSRPSRA